MQSSLIMELKNQYSDAPEEIRVSFKTQSSENNLCTSLSKILLIFAYSDFWIFETVKKFQLNSLFIQFFQEMSEKKYQYDREREKYEEENFTRVRQSKEQKRRSEQLGKAETLDDLLTFGDYMMRGEDGRSLAENNKRYDVFQLSQRCGTEVQKFWKKIGKRAYFEVELFPLIFTQFSDLKKWKWKIKSKEMINRVN